MSDIPKTKVMLCILSIDGQVRAEIMLWAIRMVKWGTEEPVLFPFDVNVCVIAGCNPIEFARNRAVDEFLGSDAEWLWFVDCDMIPQEFSHRVLFGTADVNAGPCPMFSGIGGTKACRPNVFAGDVEEGYTRIYQPGDTPIAAGTANMSIHRSVLEDQNMLTDNNGVFRRVYSEKGEVKVGEDIDFCLRAQRNGHTFGVVNEATMGHVKPTDLDEVFRCVSSQVALMNDAYFEALENEKVSLAES